jgi:hypothetical protein
MAKHLRLALWQEEGEVCQPLRSCTHGTLRVKNRQMVSGSKPRSVNDLCCKNRVDPDISVSHPAYCFGDPLPPVSRAQGLQRPSTQIPQMSADRRLGAYPAGFCTSTYCRLANPQSREREATCKSARIPWDPVVIRQGRPQRLATRAKDAYAKWAYAGFYVAVIEQLRLPYVRAFPRGMSERRYRADRSQACEASGLVQAIASLARGSCQSLTAPNVSDIILGQRLCLSRFPHITPQGNKGNTSECNSVALNSF